MRILTSSLAALMAWNALVAIPSAAADNPDLGISAGAITVGVQGTSLTNGRLMPEISTVKIEYSFDVIIPTGSTCADSIRVVYTPPSISSMATPSLSPPSETRHFDGDEQNSGAADSVVSPAGTTMKGFTTVLTVQLTRDAPAFKQVAFPVTAQAFPNSAASCPLDASATVTSTSTIVADYLPRMQFSPRSYIQSSGQNGAVLFPVEATNFGNGGSRVKTTIDEVTKGLESVQPPSEMILESKAGDPTAQDRDILLVSVRTPHHNGYTNKLYTLRANFLTRSDASQPGLAEDQAAITLTVKVQGAYVPGFDGVAALVGLAAVVLVASRARRG